MRSGFTIRGDKRLTHNLKKLEKVSDRIARKTLNEFGLDVIEESNKIVPFDTGELESAIINEPVRGISSRHFKKTIGYDTPYAIIQHEDLSMKHPGPNSKSPARGAMGQPKFLERPLRKHAMNLLDILKKNVRKAL